MNKKANALVIFIIIVVFILIVALIGVLLFLNTKHDPLKVTKNITFPQITIYLSTQDADSKEIVSANYIILDENSNLVTSQTTNKGVYNPINISVNNSLKVYCFNSNHYLGYAQKNLTPYDYSYNKTKLDCKMKRIGSLKITSMQGSIQNIDNTLILNLTSEGGTYKGLAMCVAKTPGIETVDLDKNYKICEGSTWLNYSNVSCKDFYNNRCVNLVYTYLPKNEYLCKDEKERCKSVVGSTCITEDISVPERFKRYFDKCKYLGYDLSPGQNQQILISVHTSSVKNSLDSLKILFYDYDLRYIDGNFTKVESINKDDIGAKDQETEVKYKSE